MTKPLAPPNPDLPFHGDPSSAPDPYAMRPASRRPLSDRARQEIRESLSRVFSVELTPEAAEGLRLLDEMRELNEGHRRAVLDHIASVFDQEMLREAPESLTDDERDFTGI